MLVQRLSIADGGAIELRLPVTKVDNCNIADILFISQIYNVLLELRLNSSTNVEVYSVSPTIGNTFVVRSCFLSTDRKHETY